jgi:iron(III) transport system substrate-binding protein
MKQTRRFSRTLSILLTCVAITKVSAAAPKPATSPQIVKAANSEGKILIYSTTDSAAVAPVLKDFGELYPSITVD